jgi:hypothetical protein
LGRDGVIEQRLSTGWVVRGNPGGGKIFYFPHTSPDRLWGPTQLSVPWVPRHLPGGQAAGPRRGVDHPPASCAAVKKGVALYLCSPYVSAWLVTGTSLPVLTILYEFLRAFGSYDSVCLPAS